MRVVLVGSPAARTRLRAQINGVAEVVAEYSTLTAARAAGEDADAIVLGPGRRQQHRDVEEPVETLTGRELQVLELMAEGLPNKSIATRSEERRVGKECRL